MLPPFVQKRIEEHLGSSILSVEPVGGGCIANAVSIKSDDGRFFLKWSADHAGDTFEAEAAGLAALRAAGAPLVIPQVLAGADREVGQEGYLLLEWIEHGRAGADFWDRFGRALAVLHQATSDRFGFHRDNFIGKLPQENGWLSKWPDFVHVRRLEPQVARARHSGRWKPSWDRLYDRLVTRLSDLLPADPPASTLHGDLWSGNYLVAASGQAALVDPAAYYGDREADLALTELFGGYDHAFYAAYRETWPVAPGYEERRDIYNLYHLVNHLNHFGDAYASGVRGTLERFGDA